MKFRIYATLVCWALFLSAAIVGAIPVGTAVILSITSAALLAPYKELASQCSVCPSAFDALRIATENLPNTVYRKASQTNFWTGYVDRETFPMNAGVNQTVFVIGNSEPYSNAEAWTDISLSSNVITTMCTPTFSDVDVGYNESTFAPRRFGLAGPVICRETLSFAHTPGLFMRQYENELAKRAKRTWEFDLRNAAIRLYAKAVAGTQFSIATGLTNFQGVASNSQLTQDYLDETAAYLIEAGATDADQEWVELGPDGPIFPLVIGIRAAQLLATNLGEWRTDLRYADMGKGPNATLMKRLGATRVLRNFRIVPTVLPPRFSFANGAYTQVDTYDSAASSEGTVAIISPDYKNALYEAAFVPHPMAFTAAVVKPDTAGLDWSPTNYMGEWVWKTGGEISTTYCFDPMRNYGRHFAQFLYAQKPVYPEFGVALIYRVCQNDLTYAPCVPYYG